MKKGLLVFIIICMIICAFPLVGMTIRPTTESTENRALSSFPSVKTVDGSLNLKFFQQFENYFSEHFAFRNELVFMDASIQNKVFGVSSTDRVTTGTDGWLYYTSTIDDYIGTNRLSERDIYNIAHNLRIVKKYLDERSIDLVVTIPPNKNTLYGEHMPYYASYVIDDKHEIETLAPMLTSMNIPYADLSALFREQSETLYLKRDSHWNNKGALLAYNAILDTVGYKHDDFSSVDVTRAIDDVGDLNKMLYTFYGEKEANYRYALPDNYEYLSDFTSVEDNWIETKNDTGSKNLLMLRDSFGNTLIPFMANQFKDARFSKGLPYGLESLIEQDKPDLVIFERVERSIDDFLTMPPLISAPEFSGDLSNNLHEISSNELSDSTTTIQFASMPYDSKFYMVSGKIDQNLLEGDTDILLRVGSKVYEAYHTLDNGYEAYFLKDNFQEFPVEIEIILFKNDEETYQIVQSDTIAGK